ncbi:hypothetical protein V494_02307 [Pseudogymnoascus sp. VKM F-4513 (FW-928)]|nr:hypothetical protein V494_02307 [Pseudogymnoascus sp. VKM F-4513 (FW-928)]
MTVPSWRDEDPAAKGVELENILISNTLIGDEFGPATDGWWGAERTIVMSRSLLHAGAPGPSWIRGSNDEAACRLRRLLVGRGNPPAPMG